MKNKAVRLSLAAFILFALVFAFTLAAGAASEESNLPYLSGGNVSGYAGEEKDVPFSINGSAGVSGMQLTLQYDESVFTVIDAFTDLDGAFNANYDVPGTVKLIYNGANITEDCVFFKLTVQFKTDVSLGASSAFSVDSDAENLFSTTVSGTSLQPFDDFTVESGTVSVGVIGDANGDGEVGIKDLVAVQLHIIGKKTLSEGAQYLADVDGNGVVNVLDAGYIQNYASELIDSFDGIRTAEPISSYRLVFLDSVTGEILDNRLCTGVFDEETVDVPEPNTHEGMTFETWQYSVSDGIVLAYAVYSSPETPVGGNYITVYIDSFNLQVVAYYQDAEYTEHQAPPVPTGAPEGYVFDGWQLMQNGDCFVYASRYIESSVSEKTILSAEVQGSYRVDKTTGNYVFDVLVTYSDETTEIMESDSAERRSAITAEDETVIGYRYWIVVDGFEFEAEVLENVPVEPEQPTVVGLEMTESIIAYTDGTVSGDLLVRFSDGTQMLTSAERCMVSREALPTAGNLYRFVFRYSGCDVTADLTLTEGSEEPYITSVTVVEESIWVDEKEGTVDFSVSVRYSDGTESVVSPDSKILMEEKTNSDGSVYRAYSITIGDYEGNVSFTTVETTEEPYITNVTVMEESIWVDEKEGTVDFNVSVWYSDGTESVVSPDSKSLVEEKTNGDGSVSYTYSITIGDYEGNVSFTTVETTEEPYITNVTVVEESIWVDEREGTVDFNVSVWYSDGTESFVTPDSKSLVEEKTNGDGSVSYTYSITIGDYTGLVSFFTEGTPVEETVTNISVTNADNYELDENGLPIFEVTVFYSTGRVGYTDSESVTVLQNLLDGDGKIVAYELEVSAAGRTTQITWTAPSFTVEFGGCIIVYDAAGEYTLFGNLWAYDQYGRNISSADLVIDYDETTGIITVTYGTIEYTCTAEEKNIPVMSADDLKLIADLNPSEQYSHDENNQEITTRVWMVYVYAEYSVERNGVATTDRCMLTSFGPVEPTDAGHYQLTYTFEFLGQTVTTQPYDNSRISDTADAVIMADPDTMTVSTKQVNTVLQYYWVDENGYVVLNNFGTLYTDGDGNLYSYSLGGFLTPLTAADLANHPTMNYYRYEDEYDSFVFDTAAMTVARSSSYNVTDYGTFEYGENGEIIVTRNGERFKIVVSNNWIFLETIPFNPAAGEPVDMNLGTQYPMEGEYSDLSYPDAYSFSFTATEAGSYLFRTNAEYARYSIWTMENGKVSEYGTGDCWYLCELAAGETVYLTVKNLTSSPLTGDVTYLTVESFNGTMRSLDSWIESVEGGLIAYDTDGNLYLAESPVIICSGTEISLEGMPYTIVVPYADARYGTLYFYNGYKWLDTELEVDTTNAPGAGNNQEVVDAYLEGTAIMNADGSEIDLSGCYISITWSGGYDSSYSLSRYEYTTSAEGRTITVTVTVEGVELVLPIVSDCLEMTMTETSQSAVFLPTFDENGMLFLSGTNIYFDTQGQCFIATMYSANIFENHPEHFTPLTRDNYDAHIGTMPVIYEMEMMEGYECNAELILTAETVTFTIVITPIEGAQAR